MSEETNWTDHVANGKAWFRFLLMLLFTPFLGCVGFLILAIALFQFFSVLASGESNPQLRELARDLSRFAVGIVDFLTYNTEEKPFPFTSPHSAETAGSAPPPASEAPRPARRASPARKKTTPRRRSASTRRKKATMRKEAARQDMDSGELQDSESPSESTERETLADADSEKRGK